VARGNLTIPSFKTEAEEVAWWDHHRRRVETELRRRMKDGTTQTLAEVAAAVKKRNPLRPVTVRLATGDIATARNLAARQGIGYQTYLKLLLRKALDREVARSRRERRS